jgi:hypothetical protein
MFGINLTSGPNFREGFTKTEAGKANVSRNAYNGGEWRQYRDMLKAVNAFLREQKVALRNITYE